MTTPNLQIEGSTFKQWREDKQLSQTKAAELIEISKQALSDYERGIIYPSPPVLSRMCAVYGKSIQLVVTELQPA